MALCKVCLVNLCVSERWSRLEYKQGRRRRERKRESKATGMKRPTWDEVTAEMPGSGVSVSASLSISDAIITCIIETKMLFCFRNAEM